LIKFRFELDCGVAFLKNIDRALSGDGIASKILDSVVRAEPRGIEKSFALILDVLDMAG
jgi:hypothetical protein